MWLNAFIWRAIQEPAVYLHCFPQYNQGKRAIWNSVHDTHTGEAMGYLDHFPPEIVKHKNSSDMRIELINGSIYQIMGIDGKNAALARGMNPKYVLISEYAFMDAESWYTIEPRVSQNKGTAVFISTPNGQNHFYNLYNHATANQGSDYFSSLLTIDDTSIYDPSFIDHKRAEGIPEDFIQQEYYCSFTRGAESAYYGKQIQKARDEERITSLSISKELPVHTAWDIGYGDSTAIWFFQQLNSGKLNLLHYYENTGEGLDTYLKYLDEWKCKHGVVYGRHFVPHDMQQHEFTSGVDRITTARQMGYDMTVVPKKGIDEGIQAVRSLLPHCSFDSKECKRGIQCLDFYRKKYNEALKVYDDKPLHDQYSHGADAFRYLAVGLCAYGTSTSRLTAETIREMRYKNTGR